MNKFSGKVIAAAKIFNSGKVDKNGKEPIMLNVIAGKAPNRNILSGTVAELEGFKPGDAYLIQVREVEPDSEHGRQFIWQKIMKLSALEILDAEERLGQPEIFSIEEQEDNNETADIKKSEKKVTTTS